MTFIHRVRVRYGEVDMQRVVFNAHYMAYCDDAVECWLQAKDVQVNQVGWDFMLKKTTIEWQGTATVHETIDIAVQVARWGNTSFDVLFTGTVGERPVFTNTITYVGVKHGTLETMPPPEDVKRILSAVKTVARKFYKRDPREVAPDLLNKVLVVGNRSGRIVETEAYCGAIDPGAHSYRGVTPRTEVMFGPPGHLYVYLSYGMHWCCNPVCGEDGDGVAVLVRAVEPLAGIEEMRPQRPKAKRDVDLTNGPGKLTQALGIIGSNNGADLVTGDQGIVIADDGTRPPDTPVVTYRIGFGTNAARDFPWRWFVPGNRFVSRPEGSR